MARPLKDGLDYFQLDCHMDDKVKLVEAEHGIIGFAVVVKIYQKIYGGMGYYCRWDDDVAMLFAKECGVECDALSAIIDSAVRRGIFDKGMYENFGMLTSAGIQRRYLNAVNRRKTTPSKLSFSLLDGENAYDNRDNASANAVTDYIIPDEPESCESDPERRADGNCKQKSSYCIHNVDNNPAQEEFLPQNCDDNPQSRVEESRVYESKGDYGARESAPAAVDRLTDYLAQNLLRMSPGNFADLRELMVDGITDDMVRYAVDIANAQGKRTWGYCRGILSRWLVEGVRSVEEAKAARASHGRKNGESPPGSPPLPIVSSDTTFRDLYR